MKNVSDREVELAAENETLKRTIEDLQGRLDTSEHLRRKTLNRLNWEIQRLERENKALKAGAADHANANTAGAESHAPSFFATATAGTAEAEALGNLKIGDTSSDASSSEEEDNGWRPQVTTVRPMFSGNK